MQILCILGRQPALGLAELESRFGADAITPVQAGICMLEADKVPNFDYLGGSLKAARLLTPLEFTDWEKINRYLQKNLPHHFQHIPEGKITLGISVYGLHVSPTQINATALALKKVIKKSGRSGRIVPNKENELNTAQVLHNKLTHPTGLELVIVSSGGKILLGQTIWVQDIEAYRRRDQERPKRDSRVGMLPPKLAQIIISLASSGSGQKKTLLDPFCGTGVVLQEALLQNYAAAGADLEPRMIDYTRQNLEWLNAGDHYNLQVADATSAAWPAPFHLIACETYLGRPFSSQPDPELLHKVMHDTNIIHKKFLQNAARQIPPGFRMCVAVPAWKTRNGFRHLPVLDHLEELGYNRVSFVHAETDDLVYHREDQIVARELVVLTRK